MTDQRALEARRRLATASRLVIERLVASGAPADMLEQAAAGMETFAETLAGFPYGRTYEGYGEPANAPGPKPDFFEHSPLSGLANPVAPPCQTEVIDDVVTGPVRFGGAYEGPPGCVHGGFVAAVHDEILGIANGLSRKPAMTGTLIVKYRSPTPLYTDLRLEARLERVEGRKQFCTSTIHAGDTLCSEAEGVFVTFDFDRFQALLAARDERNRTRDQA